jgi:hypothetical protein
VDSAADAQLSFEMMELRPGMVGVPVKVCEVVACLDCPRMCGLVTSFVESEHAFEMSGGFPRSTGCTVDRD